jgi:hypothetical protein
MSESLNNTALLYEKPKNLVFATLRGVVKSYISQTAELSILAGDRALIISLPSKQIIRDNIPAGIEIELSGSFEITQEGNIRFVALDKASEIISLLPSGIKEVAMTDDILAMLEEPYSSVPEVKSEVIQSPSVVEAAVNLVAEVSEEIKSDLQEENKSILVAPLKPVKMIRPGGGLSNLKVVKAEESKPVETADQTPVLVIPPTRMLGRRGGNAFQASDNDEIHTSYSETKAQEKNTEVDAKTPIVATPIIRTIAPEDMLSPPLTADEMSQLKEQANITAQKIIDEFKRAGLMDEGYDPKISLIIGRGPGSSVYLKGDEDPTQGGLVTKYREKHDHFVEPGLGTFFIRDSKEGKTVFLYPDE